LLVSGLAAGLGKREIAGELAKIGTDAAPFDTLLDIREQKKKAGDVDPEALFANYLRQIETVVAHVDRLEK
jgi:hypothetical protein